LTYSTKENHATHQLFSVRAMCRCLRIHPSGFYARLKDPLSERDREDARQTELIRKAWKDSGKVYGYRKLHDDLLDQGETCCPNLVARLAQIVAHEFGQNVTVPPIIDTRVDRYAPAIFKICHELGVELQYDLPSAIAATVRAIRNRNQPC
jgi:hypothetical protein